MINHVWTARLTTAVLILLSHSFVHHAQCSEMILLDNNILMHHLCNSPLHQIMRRQANSEVQQHLAYCESIGADAYCSSGFGQSTVDISLSCGASIETIRSEYAYCARSESGAFCGSLLPSSRITGNQQYLYLEANCSRVITSNVCPPECRAYLEDFKGNFGCCINVYLNASSYSSYTISSVNDYHLWNLCGVPLPAMDCQNHGITFNVPSNAQNCTTDEYNYKLLATLCEPNVAQPYINGVLQDNRCFQRSLNSVKDFIYLCSKNNRGEFCSLLIEGGSTSSYVSTLNSDCDSEIRNSTAACRSTCRNKLVEVRNALGCCINYYNRSTSYQNIPPPSLAYEIWEACGVETPGFCESKLSLNGSASIAYAIQWALMYTWVVVAIFSIFNLGL